MDEEENLKRRMNANHVEVIHACPWCGAAHDRATEMEQDCQPKEVDFCICIKCREVSVWEGGGSLRMASKEEQKECWELFQKNFKELFRP